MEKDMTVGTPWKLILAFFIPMLLGNCFQQVYNLVDTIIVGKGISDNALAAVGSTGSLHFFIFGFVTGLTNGVAIPMAQAYGAKDTLRLKKIVAMAFMTCMAIGLIFSILSVAGSSALLRLLQTPQDIFTDARRYMNIIFGCLFVTVLYNFFSCLLRALGDSRTPLWSIVISSVVNVILDLVFVLYFHLGVQGAAWATVIAQILSVIFCVIRLARVSIVHPRRKDWKPDLQLIGELFRLGLPVGFMNSVTAIGGMILQYFVNGMGSVYTASYSACMKLFGFFEQPGMAIGMAISTYTGQNLGAKQYDRIRQGVRSGCIMTLIISLALGSLEVFFCDQLVGIMLSSREAIAISRQFLPFGGMLLWVLGFLFIYRYACLGMGFTVMPMVSGFLELFMRVLFSLLLVKPLAYRGIAFSELSAWIGAALMLMIYYHIKIRSLHTSVKK